MIGILSSICLAPFHDGQGSIKLPSLGYRPESIGFSAFDPCFLHPDFGRLLS